MIVQPWSERIEAAETLDDLYALLTDLCRFTVLDPACSSGNFLFMAFRKMKLLEKRLLTLVRGWSRSRDEGKRLATFLETYPFVNTRQFYGIDVKPYAVELAKVTLMVAKELSYLDNKELYDSKFAALPLDNLDANIICADALLDGDKPREWPEVDAIIGNPPYQGKRNMQSEFGADYVSRLRSVYPEVDGRADFCVYWFYKAHKHMKSDCYAGLVGTKTITQNYSRNGGLDYIVKHGDTIFNAVNLLKWSGEAAVTVSIVNWKKGNYEGGKILYIGNDKGVVNGYVTQSEINSSLSKEVNVTHAIILICNTVRKVVFQGQVPGHDGYMLPVKKVLQILRKNSAYKQVLKPHLIGDELIGSLASQPSQFTIDFTGIDLIKASSFKDVYSLIESQVLPFRQKAAEKQIQENELILGRSSKVKINRHHITFFNRWWQMAYGREDMLEALKSKQRYIACAQVSKRNIFEFISKDITPNATIFAFMFDDYYSFGVIQSTFHGEWWKAKCSTLETRLRHTTNTVWDTFPWPQSPTVKQIDVVAQAAQQLHQQRTQMLRDYKMSLRELYRTLEKPGKNALRTLHDALDKAVLEAHEFTSGTDLLTDLLTLNHEVAEREKTGLPVQAPGLPAVITDRTLYVTDDCVRFNANL